MHLIAPFRLCFAVIESYTIVKSLPCNQDEMSLYECHEREGDAAGNGEQILVLRLLCDRCQKSRRSWSVYARAGGPWEDVYDNSERERGS